MNLLDLDGTQLEKELQKIIRETPHYRFWTPKEEAIVKRLYLAEVPMSAIARKLNRSIKAIQMKIFLLNLSRKPHS